MENITTIVTLVILGLFILCLTFGFLFGIIRGLMKTTARLILLVVCVVITLIFSNLLVGFLLNFNISFLNLNVSGESAGTFKEYLSLSIIEGLSQNEIVLEEKDIMALLDFSMALVSVVAGGIICFPFFFILQMITLPIYWILNAILSLGKKFKKRRLWGGLVGVASGLLIFMSILMPVTGYEKVARNVVRGFKENCDNQEMLNEIEQIDEFCLAYDDSVMVKGLRIFGIDGIQTLMFSAVTTSDVNKRKISLVQESENIGNIYSSVLYLSQIDKDNIDREKLTEALTSLFDSAIIRSAVSIAMPIVKGVAMSNLEKQEELKEYREIIEPAVDGLVDGICNMALNNDVDGLTKVLNAVFNVVDEATKIDKAGENIDDVNFQIIGKSIDDIISVDFLSDKTINDCVCLLADKLSENAGGQGEEQNNIIDGLVTNFKDKLKNADLSTLKYEKEFTAIDKIIEIMPIVKNENFDLSTDGEVIGKKIDETIALNAEIIDEDLISDFAVTAIDYAVKDKIDKENILFDSVNTIKESIKQGGLTYATEFEAFAKLFSSEDKLSEDIDFANKAAIAEIGKTFDDSLDVGSKIITKNLINDIIKKEIDKNLQKEDGYSLGDYKIEIDIIKKRLDEKDFRYEDEFGYLSQLLNMTDKLKTGLSVNELNEKRDWGDGADKMTVGEKLDEIAPSVLCGDMGLKAIDSALKNYVIDDHYSAITDIVKNNFESVKDNTKICGKTNGYTYKEITEAFDEMYKTISDEDDENCITGKSDKFSEMAEKYDRKLNELQDNIIMGRNGTRKLAILLSEEIIEKIEISDEAKKYLADYSDYLKSRSDSDEEPYNSTNTVHFGDLQVSNPFEYAVGLLNEEIE